MNESAGVPLNRRRFIGVMAGGAAAAALGARPASAAEPAVSPPDPFRLVPLGRTGLKVSLIGMGTGMKGWNRQSNQTRLGAETFEALLRHAYEKGVRLFDCADLYGTHPFVARALKDRPRDRHVLATKIWTRPNGLPEADRPDAGVLVDRFRKELQTDYLDLVLLHCQTDGQWTDQQKRQMDALAALKAKGVIRAHGVSVHSLAALKACVKHPWVDSVHARINAFGDSMDDPNPAVVAAVLKDLRAAGQGVIGMKLVGEGRYRDDPAKRDQSIKYVLDQACVDSMIVGFEKPAEVDDFAARVRQALAAGAAPA